MRPLNHIHAAIKSKTLASFQANPHMGVGSIARATLPLSLPHAPRPHQPCPRAIAFLDRYDPIDLHPSPPQPRCLETLLSQQTVHPIQTASQAVRQAGREK